MAKKKSSKPRKQESAGDPPPSLAASSGRGKRQQHAPGKPTRKQKETTDGQSSHDETASNVKSNGVEKTSPSPTALADRRDFPIVGLGASAGGLDALKQFFDAMPAESGMAFVVVTHQHAGHLSMLPELLARHTKMKVCEAADGMRVDQNCVYIAPSNGQLQLLDRKLLLIPMEAGLHLTIDSFFRSLAIDQKSYAIGIVLSGTGSDGTLGIKAIKGEAGMVMAQEPAGAQYDGMPRSAMATGLVDFVLPVAEMPTQLVAYVAAPFIASANVSPPTVHPGLADIMPKIVVLLRNRTRHDFTHYKTNTVRRRIERRMSVNHICNARDYLRFLRESPHELDVLFRELLIGVTRFFRDPEAFASLAEYALPALMRGKPKGDSLRIWSAGCSTGEEAYSLAMVAQEVKEQVNPHLQLQVFATDLDERAIDIARRGVYPSGIAADVTEPRLRRFFVREEENYRVTKELRELVIFAPHDVISDPPFTKLDVLACRNLLIYLDGELQKKLMPVFHYAIKPGGVLFLGNSESVGSFTMLFEVLDKKWKLFERRLASPCTPPPASRGTFEPKLRYEPDENTVTEEPTKRHVELDLQRLLERRILHSYAPPTVVTSDRGEIVDIHGRTGAYLEPAPGKPSNNILTMARQGLQPALSALMRRATSGNTDAAQHGIRLANNGGTVLVNVVVRPIAEPEMIRGLLMITFEETSEGKAEDASQSSSPKRKSRGRAVQLEQQLLHMRENLQSTIEELETTNEELKSSNEELHSTNEELQSTNEELETSKEEMQSLNEELQTVNAELKMRIEDLAIVNDDMTNLLNNTNIATVFLNNDLNINRFTNAAIDVIKLIPSDVGRPIGDLVSSLDYDLAADARAVLATLQPRETVVQSDRDRWYQVRLMPYRTSQNVIDGLVATFVDVTSSKLAEIEIAKAAADAQSIVDTVREPLLVLDHALRVMSCNEAFVRMFETEASDAIGKPIFELGGGQWNAPELRERLQRLLSLDSAFEDVRVEYQHPSRGTHTMSLNGRRLEQATILPGRILIAIQDVTGRNQ